MIVFGSNWYQMHGWVLAWRCQIEGFGSNWYQIHGWVLVSMEVPNRRIW